MSYYIDNIDKMVIFIPFYFIINKSYHNDIYMSIKYIRM